MKKIALFAALLSLAPAMYAQSALDDSLQVEMLVEAVVKGVRVQPNAPFAVANVNRKALQSFSSTGQELPFLLSSTPGVLAWSENGVGTGTTYMRIRGAGDSRINVTIDGVPLNSPEDQCVFWANMNSYSALMESVQIQRGVGTSTNGDGAFGGSIAMRSKSPSYVPFVEYNASFGSYNTYTTGISLSSGLLNNKFVVDGSFHTTGTDGYVHGTSGRSGSWYGGFSYLGRNVVIRYKNIGNFEHTGQAWNGVTAGTDDLSLMDGTYGSKTGIKTYADMYKAGLGKYNSLYESLDTDTYKMTRHTLNNGEYWPKTTDNFTQDHNILSAAWNISDKLTSTLSLHYTYGYGYYEEFRANNKLSKFGFASFTGANGKVKRSDFVRQKGLSQNTAGAVWNINYKADKLEILAGASAQSFWGNHFGYLTYVGNKEVAEHYSVLSTLTKADFSGNKYQYYDSDAVKNDMNTFIKATYNLCDNWTAFADVQYRFVSYTTDGVNDKFIEQADGSYKNHVLDIDAKYHFINPKAGISYTNNGHHAYASVALSSREPERNNFTDNGNYPAPKAEHLTDFELGYQFTGDALHAGVNAYYMDYTNQFVQTGDVSDIGESLTTNIKDSYRMGLEFVLGIDVTSWLSLEGNAALSQNKILDFDEVVEDWDNGSRTIHYDNSTLAFSPSAIIGAMANVHFGAFKANWNTKYVSRQYLDNTENIDRSLPSYCTSGASASYTFKFNKAIKELELGVNLNNIFNAHYASSGWVYSAICDSYGHPNDNRYYQIGFIPSAGFTALGSVRIRF